MRNRFLNGLNICKKFICKEVDVHFGVNLLGEKKPMKKEKTILNENLAHAIFNFIFRTFGLDKKIAKEILSDPIIQIEIKKMQKSMQTMDDIIKRRHELQKQRGQI